MLIKFKKLSPRAVAPSKAHPSDAGADLTATSKDIKGDIITYGTDIAVEIPEGYVGLLFPRSSVCKKDLMLTNCVGVIDAHYRGEIMMKYRLTRDFAVSDDYMEGERIGQLVIVPIPDVAYIEADELSETDRGTGGYGSTGN